MPFAILGTPKPQFFDSSGSPLASGTLTIQEPADDTNKASYPTNDDFISSNNTSVIEMANSWQTIQDYTTGAHTTLRDFTGTTTAAEALQLLETLVDDLISQGILK